MTLEAYLLAEPGVLGVNIRHKPGDGAIHVEYVGTATVERVLMTLGRNPAELLMPDGVYEALVTRVTPIPTELACPKCGLLHVDPPEFVDRPHRTHLCRPEVGGCGELWRPYDYPTVGVKALADPRVVELAKLAFEVAQDGSTYTMRQLRKLAAELAKDLM